VKHHPAISILLALWFGLSAGLGPRFLCICSDGTATTQFGEQFCCDDLGGDSCPVPSEQHENSNLCTVCPDGGCQSTAIESESIVAVDRFEKDTEDNWSLDGPDDPLVPWFEFLADRLVTTAHLSSPPFTSSVGLSDCHLRSVILLV
tara:strand:- start:19690 stop:20130 length:441 start_codon:yes stop_codon:yes gene_type:complete